MTNTTLPTTLHRTVMVDREALATRAASDDRIPVSISSDAPIERHFGLEVLVHTREAVDMSRASRGLSVLFNHDTGQPVGRLEDIRLQGGRLRGSLRFGRSARAVEVRQDVEDGILTDFSVGYSIDKWREQVTDAGHTYFAERWTPMEASIVPVPADHTVGVGRSAALQPPEPRVRGGHTMTDTPPPVRDDVAIDAIGRAFGCESLASRAKQEGKTLEQFRHMIEIEQLRKASTERPAGFLDMSERESALYSPAKAIWALASGGKREGLEWEASRAIAGKLNRSTDGFFMPLDLKVRASVTGQVATTASLGGSAVATVVMPIIDILRVRSVANRAGATFLPGLQGNVQFPRQITGNALTWVGENPSSANTLGQSTFDTVTLSPKTATADSAFSRQMLAQSSQDVQSFVINDLTTAMAIGIDNAVFNGSGSGSEPRGIRNVAAVTNRTLGANGAALTWANIVDFESDVANADADLGRLSYVFNSKTRGKLKQTLQNTVAGANWIWEGGNDPGTVNGYNAYVSNQLPSNRTQGTSTTVCSAVVMGDFSQLLIGEWGGGIEVLVNPYLYAGQGMIAVHTIGMIDIALRHPESFSRSDAVIT